MNYEEFIKSLSPEQTKALLAYRDSLQSQLAVAEQAVVAAYTEQLNTANAKIAQQQSEIQILTEALTELLNPAQTPKQGN